MVLLNEKVDSIIPNLEQQFYSGLKESFKSLQEKAWNHFLKRGFPKKNEEAFQYLPLTQLYQEKFTHSPSDEELIQESLIPEIKGEVVKIILLNGKYCRELSDLSKLPKQCIVTTLQEAHLIYGHYLQLRMSKMIHEENDPFTLLNLALQTSALFFLVPPKMRLEIPIYCINLVTANHPSYHYPRIHLVLGKESSMKWIFDFQSVSKEKYLHFGLIDIFLEESSNLQLANLVKPKENSWHFDAIRSSLKKNSSLDCLHYTEGSKSARQDMKFSLIGENARVDLKGLAISKEMEQTHAHVFVDHEAPFCFSNQFYKTVLCDSSQSSFEGKIYVREKAQKTEAYQLNQNLILGEYASAKSKPNLEIFADDVKASHGASFSQIDQSQLFYLKTRGLNEQKASRLLIEGFCSEILDHLFYEPLKQKFKFRIKNSPYARGKNE
ncbi:MAG: Fe-S cluster assembly protein SufD [Chlamydiae bacterium]|nr:Fe-S cluster assembly protein SufD [Chlamydiota bacterium]